MTLIAFGGLDLAQSTASAPGSCNVSITPTNMAGLLRVYMLEATTIAVFDVTGVATAPSTETPVVNDASTIEPGFVLSALSAIKTGGGGTLTFPPGVPRLLDTTPVTGFGPDNHIDFATPAAAGNHAFCPAASGGTGDILSLVDAASTAVAPVSLRSLPEGSVVDRGLVQAVRILAEALAENSPCRGLFVSADRSTSLDGALVPATLLVRGATVAQVMQTRTIEYHHIKPAPHDINIAEGAETDSDIENCGHFEQPNRAILRSDAEPGTWKDACAPVVVVYLRPQMIRSSIAFRTMGPVVEAAMPRVA